jgi:hypothetical protein
VTVTDKRNKYILYIQTYNKKNNETLDHLPQATYYTLRVKHCEDQKTERGQRSDLKTPWNGPITVIRARGGRDPGHTWFTVNSKRNALL